MAAANAALFIVAFAALLAAVMWIVTDTQRAALLQENDDDISSVQTGFLQEGPDEAKEVLRQRIGDPPNHESSGPQTYMRLQGRADGSLGNLPPVPESPGTGYLTFFPETGRIAPGQQSGEQAHLLILGRGLWLDSAHFLFVGRDTSALDQTRSRILSAFSWLMLASVAIAGGGGVILARRLMRRVDNVARTCEGIIAGRLNERIPADGRGAEWDRLTKAINGMLSRITSLLENLQQVSSDIAHDLRTPLTRMRHRLEIARSGDPPPSARDCLTAIDRAVEDTDQILALFDAVLRISQIESGTRAASFKNVSLKSILEDVCALYAPLAEDSDRSIHCNALEDAVVPGDAELLFQMLSNLVENAIRHTPAGSHIELALKCARVCPIVEVSDNGHGVPESDLDKVTRRFFRVEGSRSSPGHGLGLALVSAVAALHGATLTLFNSRPGLTVRLEFLRDSALPLNASA